MAAIARRSRCTVSRSGSRACRPLSSPKQTVAWQASDATSASSGSPTGCRSRGAPDVVRVQTEATGRRGEAGATGVQVTRARDAGVYFELSADMLGTILDPKDVTAKLAVATRVIVAASAVAACQIAFAVGIHEQQHRRRLPARPQQSKRGVHGPGLRPDDHRSYGGRGSRGRCARCGWRDRRRAGRPPSSGVSVPQTYVTALLGLLLNNPAAGGTSR